MDRLGSASLQAVELYARDTIKLVDTSIRPLPVLENDHENVREWIDTCGDRNAVEVESRPLFPNYIYLWRLAWRRWPARGAPDRQAAEAAHERAHAWAAGGRR